MKSLLPMMVIPICSIILTACSSGPGSDSISSRKGQAGTGISDCTTECHNSTSTISPDPLVTNGSGTYGKHGTHVSNTGIACEKCHLNYMNSATHMNGQLDTGDASVLIVYFDATNPSGAWINDTGPSLGQCSSLFCHGADTLDWYGTGTASFLSCGSCHSYAIGTRRQVTGAGGDFGNNASIVSHHVTTTGDPVREQCLVCHDQSTHTAGTVRLRNADTGASITYDPAVPASIEPFCLSCHDGDSALATAITGSALSPFNDGSTLGSPPYPYAVRIASSWAKSFGHGPNGNHVPASKLTCLGTGLPGTGCHGNNGMINAHGSVNQVLGARAINLNINDFYVEGDYDLCFNCHTSYPGIRKEDILGVKFGGLLDSDYGFLTGPNGWNPPYYIPGVVTRFADHNDAAVPILNDGPFFGTPNVNLHWYHLGVTAAVPPVGGIVCINCHDVHGSNTPYGALYDELSYRHTTTLGSNIIGEMTITAYTDSNYLRNYPTYCSFNCHPLQGPTKAWLYPIAE